MSKLFQCAAVVSAVTALACVSGCASQGAGDDTTDETADELSKRARPLLEGLYQNAILYTSGPGGESFNNPPQLQDYGLPLVRQAHSRGFQLDFRNKEDGESTGFIPIDCTMLGDTKAFVCRDQLGEGPPPGMILDGAIAARRGWSRAIQAKIFQRISYTGVVVSNKEFIANLTVTTTCEGTPSECEELGKFSEKLWHFNVMKNTKAPTRSIERSTWIENEPAPQTPAPGAPAAPGTPGNG